jgi:hypothetical protein
MHNTLASLLSGVGGLVLGTFVDWSGWIFMFIVIIWAISRVQKRVRIQLRGEAESGVITIAQYHTACSAWAQAWARTTALFNGSYRDTARFYQLCGELAHKKHQYVQYGDEGQNLDIIAKTRVQLTRLSPRAQA